MTSLSDLPDAMLTEIAKRLKKLEDYTSFSSVSKSFCAAAKTDYFEGLRLRQHTPYLMLSVREGGDDDIRELYSLVENAIVESVKVPNFKKKKCFESLGWLLVTEVDGKCSLLDPFSGTEIPLPHQNTFPEYYKYLMQFMGGDAFFWKMVLSSNPNETSDFVLMVIGGCLREVAFWRLGDQAWTKIYKREGAYTDIVHYGGGKFYAYCHNGYVWGFDLSATDNEIKSSIVVSFMPPYVVSAHDRIHIPTGDLGHIVVGHNRTYLLKSIDDSLLLIWRSTPKSGTTEYSYVSNKFRVYDLDVVRGTWKEIFSLGNMSVFLGYNSTTFVDASRFPRVVKPNHIYFTDDNWELYGDPNRGPCSGYDSGVYNFETGSVEPVYLGKPLLSKFSPSFWITPCF